MNDNQEDNVAEAIEDHHSMVESTEDRKIFAEMEANVKTIPVSQITLLYTCHPCNERASQELGQITEAGTAICPECGNDMQLDESVDVSVDADADGPSIADIKPNPHPPFDNYVVVEADDA